MAICNFCELEKGELFSCQKCGKPICADCYNLTTMHYCYDCAQSTFFAEKQSSFRLGLIFVGLALAWILSLATFFVLILFTEKGLPRWVPLIPLFVFFLFSFYPSWDFIKRKLNKPGIVMLVIKLILSLIGCVVILPYYIVSAIKCFKLSKNASNNSAILCGYPHPDPRKNL